MPDISNFISLVTPRDWYPPPDLADPPEKLYGVLADNNDICKLKRAYNIPCLFGESSG